MSDIFTPQRQVEMAKPNGNVYTYHLLDMEVAPSSGGIQAIAHLAIAASEKIPDPKSEIQESLIFMHYIPGLRQTPRRDKPVSFNLSQLVFLDRYQKPTIKNNLRYFTALIATHEFELDNKRIEPEANASAYDFVLSIMDEKSGKKYDGYKYLGI